MGIFNFSDNQLFDFVLVNKLMLTDIVSVSDQQDNEISVYTT